MIDEPLNDEGGDVEADQVGLGDHLSVRGHGVIYFELVGFEKLLQAALDLVFDVALGLGLQKHGLDQFAGDALGHLGRVFPDPVEHILPLSLL